MPALNSNLKPLLLNTYDKFGGAAIATYRIHRGLRSIGINSNMLVQIKKINDSHVYGPNSKIDKVTSMLRPSFDEMPARLYRERKKVFFSTAWVPDRLSSKVNRYNPDIVHLFWVGHGFLKIETLKKFKGPFVWTLHDMWPFTGGCHYDDGCGKFRNSCCSCPILHSSKKNDLARFVWERKHRSWKNIPIVIVATSQWMARMARESSLFKHRRIEVIPNGLNTDQYKPIDKKVARSAYNLPLEKPLILFSAFSATSDKRKGGQYLLSALEKFSRSVGSSLKPELLIIGAQQPNNPIKLDMKIHYMGYFHDEISQVLLYSAADVLVAPSVQENLANTVMESLACGTPVVAFNIGGMPDMIDHKRNGYLAIPFEPNDLAEGIRWVTENKERHYTLSQQARQIVKERFTLEAIAERYSNLYHDIL